MTVFHEGDGDESGFTCCAFAARQRFLMLGTCFGRLNLFDVSSGEKVANHTCHTSAITHLEPSRVGSPGTGVGQKLRLHQPNDGFSWFFQDGKLLLTSASWSFPLSALWNVDGVFSKT